MQKKILVSILAIILAGCGSESNTTSSTSLTKDNTNISQNMTFTPEFTQFDISRETRSVNIAWNPTSIPEPWTHFRLCDRDSSADGCNPIITGEVSSGMLRINMGSRVGEVYSNHLKMHDSEFANGSNSRQTTQEISTIFSSCLTQKLDHWRAPFGRVYLA